MEKDTYRFCGMPLTKYCKEHNLSYNTVKNFLRQGYTVKEAVNITKKELKKIDLCDEKMYTKRNLSLKTKKERDRLIYKGVPLKQYCKDNNISYFSVIIRLCRFGNSIEEAIKTSIEKNGYKNLTCYNCPKRNCLGCPNYLFEEQDKKWKEEHESEEKGEDEWLNFI